MAKNKIVIEGKMEFSDGEFVPCFVHTDTMNVAFEHCSEENSYVVGVIPPEFEKLENKEVRITIEEIDGTTKE